MLDVRLPELRASVAPLFKNGQTPVFAAAKLSIETNAYRRASVFSSRSQTAVFMPRSVLLELKTDY
jgi:hypothetical protein